jgi:hypothetical protein
MGQTARGGPAKLDWAEALGVVGVDEGEAEHR